MQYKLTPVLVLAILGLAVASPRNNIKEPANTTTNATTSDTQITATASPTSAVGAPVSVDDPMTNCSTSAAPPASTTTPVTPLNTTTSTPPKNTTVPVTGDAKDLNAPLGAIYLGMGLLAAAGYLAAL